MTNVWIIFFLFFGGLIQEIKTSPPSIPFTQQVQFNLQFKNDPQKQQKQQGAQIIITTTIVRSVLALIGVCDYVCTYVCLFVCEHKETMQICTQTKRVRVRKRGKSSWACVVGGQEGDEGIERGIFVYHFCVLLLRRRWRWRWRLQLFMLFTMTKQCLLVFVQNV